MYNSPSIPFYPRAARRERLPAGGAARVVFVQQPFCVQEKTPRPVPWQNGNAANRDSIQSKSLGGREEGSLPRFHIHTLLFLSPLHTLNVFNFLLLGLFGELAEDEHIDAAAFGRLKGKFGTREGAVPARITERTKT